MMILKATAILLLFLIAGCSSGNSTELQVADVPNLSEQADLSGLDTGATQSEIIRLLNEGYVMYTRIESFNRGGHQSPACTPDRVIARDECTDWPEKLVLETWTTTDLSGKVREYFGRQAEPDGTLLATGLQGDWTDVRTGETWTFGPISGPELIKFVEGMSTSIERIRADGPNAIDGEYLGRPSVVIPAGEFEYQVANPMLSRETRWQDASDGTRFMLSEFRVSIVAMLPPGSFPEFALAAEN